MKKDLFMKVSHWAVKHPIAFKIIGGLGVGGIMGASLYLFEGFVRCDAMAGVEQVVNKLYKEHPEEMKALDAAIINKKKEETTNE